MQPFHSVIAVGISAVVALGSIDAASAQTTPSVNPHSASEPASSSNPGVSPATEPAPTPETAPTPTEPIAPDSAPAPDSLDNEADRVESNPTAPETSDSLADPIATPPVSPAEDAAPRADSSAPVLEAAPAPDAAEPAQAETLSPAPAPSSAPEYLDADPNPLQFPTSPQEVGVVGTQPITLRQALELAQRNSLELRNAQLELERSRAALRQAQAANEPTLDLGTSVTAQETEQPGATTFDPNTNSFEAGDTETSIDTTLNGSLSLNYDLFTSGQRSATIRANERQVRFQELQLELIAEELRLNVSRDYYDMQEADEQVRIARSTLSESLRNLQDAEAQERAGVGTRFAVLQAQVEVANARQTLTQRLSEQRIARRQLVQRLGLAQSVDVSAAEPVEIADLWNLSLEESIVLAYRNRAELEQQLVQREISQQRRRVALAQARPQISLSASYNVQNTLDNNEGFDDSYSFGAQLNWRLFDGGSASANADQEETNIAIAENQFANLRNQIRFQVEQAYLNRAANFENIQTARLAVEQATESLRLARLRFQAGVGTQLEVLEAITALNEAELNLVQAVLGYNRSLAELQRAVSNYLEGGIVETP